MATTTKTNWLLKLKNQLSSLSGENTDEEEIRKARLQEMSKQLRNAKHKEVGFYGYLYGL